MAYNGGMVKMTRTEVAARREALGLTQAELAAELGVHVLTVSRWERGIRAIPEMLDLALEALERRRAARRRRHRRTRGRAPGPEQ